MASASAYRRRARIQEVVVTCQAAKMQGLMQEWPLTVPSVLAHAERNHAEQTVHTRTVEGHMHSYTYAEMAHRSKCGKMSQVILLLIN